MALQLLASFACTFAHSSSVTPMAASAGSRGPWNFLPSSEPSSRMHTAVSSLAPLRPAYAL
eukprot:6781643-Prymnesium_polylepis.1